MPSGKRKRSAYWGNSRLEEFVNECDQTEYTTNADVLRKRDKALISAIFLTGGRIADVIALTKKNLFLMMQNLKE